MTLPSEVAAVVSARNAQAAILIKFDFASVTKRVWTGFMPLVTRDGFSWDGLGEAVTIEGLAPASAAAASSGSLRLSGVSPLMLQTALGEAAEYEQRPVAIFLQAFVARIPVGLPCPIALRIMTAMDVTRNADTRTVSVTHESPYVGRNQPANGYYTDRDQQNRFPGDLACERVPSLQWKRDRWPDY